MRARRSVLLLVASFTLFACNEQHSVPTGDATLGRALVEAKCQSCHAIGETDASTLPEAPPFREIVTRWPPENLAEALAEGIEVSHDGVEQMPEIQLEPEQIDNLIAYLQTLQPPK